jgi:sugar/nucleoside kinase (ribokinase family)
MFVVIGTTTVDLFISGIDKMPRIDGDEYTVNSLAWCSNPLVMTCGGNAGNSAYVLATLGAQVGLCSTAGQDALGDMICGWLAARGVDLDGVWRSADYGTSTNTTLLDEHLNRLNFYHPGALQRLRYDHLPDDYWRDVSALLITSYPIMTALRPDGYRAALAAARVAGAITALDIGPAIGEPVTVKELAPLLPMLDYLLTNDYELGVCTGITGEAAAAQWLIDAGAQAVVVKRGADGVTLYRPQHTPLVVAGFPVEASVTVGAGDSFNSGFLYALQQGLPLGDALRFGNATAAMVVATGKSVLGAPNRTEVETFIQTRTGQMRI